MKVLNVDRARPDERLLAEAAEIIVAGGVVAFPTETFYGLAADPRNDAAVERLFKAKERAPDQPVALIAADMQQVEQYVGTVTDLARKLAVAFWPGPLTLVIPASSAIVAEVHRATGRVGVRVPSDAVARTLARACGFAVTATSANISGEPATVSPDDVVRTLEGRIDALVDAGVTAGGLASTVVDVCGPAPVLLRAGAVPWNRVLECR